MKFASNAVLVQPYKQLSVIHFVECHAHVKICNVYLFTGVKLTANVM